jgi:hypothetical protein
MSLDYGEGSGIGSLKRRRGLVLVGWGSWGDLPSGFTVLAGVAFLMGVDLDADVVAGLTGVGPVVFVTGVDVVSFLTAVGNGFLVAAGVVFDAELIGVLVAVTGVFLAGVDVVAGLLVEAVGSVFCVPSGVLALTGVAFAGVGAFGAAGVEVEVLVAFSFLGTRFTGAVVVSVALVIGGVVFFTGAALVADDVAVLVGVIAVFFAVCPLPWATLEIFPTLAI